MAGCKLHVPWFMLTVTCLRHAERPSGIADWSLTSAKYEAEQDEGACRTSRPRHYLPTGRGGRHRPDGARHPRRPPPIASATAMRMIAIHAQTERKRLDRSVRCAEKHRRRARTRRLRGLIRPVPEACATKDADWGEKCLSSGQNHAIFTSTSMPLGECRSVLQYPLSIRATFGCGAGANEFGCFRHVLTGCLT